MTAKLKAKIYDFGGDCPKCKALDPMRVHCEGCKKGKGEHLDSMCLRCGYSWIARPADYKPIVPTEKKITEGGNPA